MVIRLERGIGINKTVIIVHNIGSCTTVYQKGVVWSFYIQGVTSFESETMMICWLRLSSYDIYWMGLVFANL